MVTGGLIHLGADT